MKILYLNCARRLSNAKGETPQRKWLVDFVVDNDIDIVCLAESSNYDIGESLPNVFIKENRWLSEDTPLMKQGFKFNICSKIKASYMPIDYCVNDELFDEEYTDILVDYGKGTLISIKTGDIEIVAVHIQHPGSKYAYSPYNIYYEMGLRKLLRYMTEHKPIAVFGDFNNYPGDASFEKIGSYYHNVNTDENAYSYISSQGSTKFLIDHTFALYENVKMEYVPALENGFDHNGMLITVE
jgi:hypothetical protein